MSLRTVPPARQSRVGRSAVSAAPSHWWARRGLLTELSHPSQAVAYLTPNWYASVMGTGIVAVAAAKLPIQLPGLHLLGTLMWVLAAVLLVVLTAATVAHWVGHPVTARSHATHPVMAHFYGAPPMAMMTVGAGTLLLGRDLLGLPLALDIDMALWTAGTLTGLVAAVVVPYLMVTRHTVSAVRAERAFGGWLMPVVPPMVSASTGALLVPHIAAGPARLALVLACYAMFGLSLIASIVVIALVCWRLVVHQVGDPVMVPTLWIVLGPLGQSITAAGLLGGVAAQALPVAYAPALRAFGLVYGLTAWGIALVWAGIAGTITVRTLRQGMPFGLTWWSFTFPVGTVVTGTSGLALATGSGVLRWVAVALFAALVAAWAVVAVRTLGGSLVRGHLFLPPASVTR